MFYEVVQWFMTLEEPNMAQAGLVSVVTGAGAAWFGLYVNSGVNNGNNPVVVQTQSSTMGSASSYRGGEEPEEDSPSGYYR